MPPDIHPLPDDINAYVRSLPLLSLSSRMSERPNQAHSSLFASLSLPQFVYPFTLEPHILAHGPPHRAQTAARQTAHVAYLIGREEAKAERKRKELARVAPGWSGSGGAALVPDRPKSMSFGAGGGPFGAGGQQEKEMGQAAGGGGEGASFGGLGDQFAGLDLSSPPPPPPSESKA